MHHFNGRRDGSQPSAGLIEINGTLYGTTTAGGTHHRGGTIFSTTLGGEEKVLHSFGLGADGSFPAASLISVNNTLYGTTLKGGAYQCKCGTVFSVSTLGSEQVVHSFGSSGDGSKPLASLVDVNGTLYGTTEQGGAYGWGTVFSISTSGSEKVLYSFAGGSDGARPDAGLTAVNGTLLGTTAEGGGTTCYYGEGCGTVYSVSTSGVEKVVYRFTGGTSDGQAPSASLVDVNGTLYGTTEIGGAYGLGTIFSVTLDGQEAVLHSFGSGKDGARPTSALIDVDGTFYGTTINGGADNGRGTVFSVTAYGDLRVLHSFGRRHGGEIPSGGVIDVDGALYDTAQYGYRNGSGEVFSLTL